MFLKNFYNNFSFLLAFMILVNIFYMLLGEKFTEGFLLLVLAGMLLTNKENIDKFEQLLKK